MSLAIGPDIEDEIRQHKFEKVARLLREGKAGELSLTAQNLLAGHLEGTSKRLRGRPRDEKQCLHAEYFYSEYMNLRHYGRTSEECTKYLSENYVALGKETLSSLKGHGLSRQAAIERLAEIHIMGTKNVERLVDMGKKIDEFECLAYNALDEP